MITENTPQASPCGVFFVALYDALIVLSGKRLYNGKKHKGEYNGSKENGHYLSFAALLTGDSVILRKVYPEWDLQLRIPMLAHGTLLWYCTRDGLFYQYV